MPDVTLLGVCWFIVTALVGAVMWAAQIGPEQASSNLALWVKKLGVHHVPAWLRSRNTDRLVLKWGKVALAGLAIIGVFGAVKLTAISYPALGMLLSSGAFVVCAILYWAQSVPLKIDPTGRPPQPGAARAPDERPPTADMPALKEPAKRTPRQLLSLYEGRTPFQADKLMESFKGLWVESEGEILNLLPDGRPSHSIAVLKNGNDTIECRFGPEWANHLGRYDIGESLKFRGKISPSQNGSQLYLLDCDLVTDSTRRTENAPDQPSAAAWQLVFPSDANLDSKQSLFVRSWTLLPSGNPLQRKFSYHRLYVGVDNLPNSRTLRNARVVIESISKPPHATNLRCVSESTGTDRADIHPGATEYFLIGEGTDETDRGLFSPRITDLGEYERALAELDQRLREHIGFILLPANGCPVPLLKNDGIELEIIAYADDIPPVKSVFMLNTRSRIELFETCLSG